MLLDQGHYDPDNQLDRQVDNKHCAIWGGH